MYALFAASNPHSYLGLLCLLWILFIKGLVLWWIVQAVFKCRWLWLAALGVIGVVVLVFAGLMLRLALDRPYSDSAKQVSVASEPAPKPDGPAAPPAPNRPASILVRVATDADVWLEGAKGKQTGRSRRFQTPPLETGEEYDYEVRARWLQDGRVMDETRRVKVRAGGATEVDFTRPQ